MIIIEFCIIISRKYQNDDIKPQKKKSYVFVVER
jgi:hypothetical protein